MVTNCNRLKLRSPKDEGNETITNCNALKMLAKDGKNRLTDCLNTKGVLRLVQSISSPKAEPFKMWLAPVGGERLHGKLDQSVTSNDKNHLQLHRCCRYTVGITLNIAFSKANKPWERCPEEKPTGEGKKREFKQKTSESNE